MSDQQPDEQPQDQPQSQDQPQPPEGEAKAFDAEYVDKLRKEAAKYRTEAKTNADAAKRLAEIEEANKSENQKLAERADAEFNRAQQAEAELLRYKVATDPKFNIPTNAMKFLTGTTREEIEASAKDVLELIGDAGKPRAPKPDPNQGRSPFAVTSPAAEFASIITQQLNNS